MWKIAFSKMIGRFKYQETENGKCAQQKGQEQQSGRPVQVTYMTNLMNYVYAYAICLVMYGITRTVVCEYMCEAIFPSQARKL
jgi:hypothetical protein